MKPMSLSYTISRERDCHELVYDAKVEHFVDEAKSVGGTVSASYNVHSEEFSLVVDFPRSKFNYGKFFLDNIMQPPAAMAA